MILTLLELNYTRHHIYQQKNNNRHNKKNRNNKKNNQKQFTIKFSIKLVLRNPKASKIGANKKSKTLTLRKVGVLIRF